MKRGLSILVLAAAAALAQEHSSDKQTPPHSPEAAGHASEEGHGGNPMELTWKWVNFAILAGGLGYLAVKMGGPFFRARTEAIQQGIREAAAIKADSEARAAEIERRVSNLSHEVERLRAESKEEIAAEGARMRSEAEKALLKVQANAEAEIASAAKQATQELKAYSAQLALELAAQQIQSRMSPETQDQLIGRFIDDLQTKASKN